MSNQLHQHIVKLVPTFESEVEKVLNYFEKQSFPENHVLINEGNEVSFTHKILPLYKTIKTIAIVMVFFIYSLKVGRLCAAGERGTK